MGTSGINICQPGFRASCALCCGSHNFTAGIGHAGEVYCARASGMPAAVLEPLHRDAIQCGYIGFIDSDRTRIGCIAYHLGPEKHPAGDFFGYTCKNFSCLSREVLSDTEILFAARLMGDWFYYSLLITDIAVLREYHERFTEPQEVPPAALARLKEYLAGLLITPCKV